MNNIPQRVVERMVKAGFVPVIRGERPDNFTIGFSSDLVAAIRADEAAYRVARAAEARAANPPPWARR